MHRARREHELLVGDLEAAGIGRVDGHEATLLVERGGRAEQQLGVPAHLAERDDDVAGLEHPEAASGRIGV